MKGKNKKNGRLDFIKITNMCPERNLKRMIKQNTDFEKTPTKHISDKGLVSKIYKKKLLKLNNRKSINPIKNKQKEVSKTYTYSKKAYERMLNII